MKVSKLIEMLSDYNPDEEVYLNISDDYTRQPYALGECWFDDYELRGAVGDEDPDKDYDDLKKVVVIW